ncbi:SLC13 family permease [Robertkochia solimangrovi]|uniref:SLC13 family permease n=1 Tax=Robertkochia solimangrovi TaxID=2213046 RepID=UPI00117CCE36|nr:SLC13 family permease [Robertkochia solimangrovi]TRZ42142.1 SLC13/DASS family transporter [Robertkochia solimangrovi]
MATIQIQDKVNFRLIIAGIIFFIGFISFFDLQPGEPQVTFTAAIGILMAFWWITEAIPIGATSLLPLVLFPFMGVMDGKVVAESYINYIIFLYIGGFIMALSIERWHLHKRIALKILSLLGGSPLRILSGFMLASGILSMWMSNTATAMMMLPIAFSVIHTLENIYSEANTQKFASGLLLGIAYGCSIGGIATLVGTPPNLSFVRIYDIMFPHADPISFGNWFVFAVPLAFILFIFTLWYLYMIYKPGKEFKPLPGSFFKEEYNKLGRMTPEEKRVFLLFNILVFLWIFRSDITIGNFVLPGWSRFFSQASFINDGSIAIFVALLLFILPSSKKDRALADWKIASGIPWHIVLLFGGGFALASGFMKSGLSDYLGHFLVTHLNTGTEGFMIMNTALMSILTEFTSNTATTEMMLPIVGGLAKELGTDPLLLMIPVTLAGSMAFMFPIATPPNAIIFGASKLTIKQMAFTGFLLNIVAVLLICVFTIFWGAMIFGYSA